YPESAVSSVKKIILPYTASYLSFEFSAVNLTYSEYIRYAYRLKGFDDDWIFSGKRRFAAFSNLDPGTYYFEVKATNNIGKWSDSTAQLAVVIEPPFWHTWWFTLLAILFFLAILYGLHRFRLERALEVERLRVGIASDLHDDIGATLTKISLYADLLNASKQQTTESGQLLQKIASMGRDTLRNLADIVWAIDARNDSMGNLISKIQEFAMDMLSKKDIEVNFKKEGIDMDASISAEKRQHIYLICKEAINNIIKHANATKVNISFIAKNHKIDVLIIDNGSGLPKDKKNELGNGLRNIEQRAKKLEADLQMKEKNGLSIILQGIGL
ncbi:MAG: triple tyrosine motif-containing protein, partial [Bacteroidota bacterium]